MEDDEKAKEYLDRLRIETSRIVTIMMEAERDGMLIDFNIQPVAPYAVHLRVSKTWT